MKQRIIKQITKKLNISEAYLAHYLGITLSFLQTIKKTKGWSKDGKDLRLYRLNKIINILRNKGIKKSEDFKNILDNERFMFKDGEDDFSYISVIKCQLSDMTEFVDYLVFEIKTEYIMEKADISKSLLAGMLDTTKSRIQNKIVQINKLYSFIKKIIKIKNEFHLSILLEPFSEIKNNTPLFYILEDSMFYSECLPKVESLVKKFYEE